MSGIKVEQLSEDEIAKRGIRKWSTWSSPVKRFEWSYDQVEECYILEGHVIIVTDKGNTEFKKGDFVTFPTGLKCTWDVKEAVKKHYNFK
jgi:uncharacterized cupin superfamily protein